MIATVISVITFELLCVLIAFGISGVVWWLSCRGAIQTDCARPLHARPVRLERIRAQKRTGEAAVTKCPFCGSTDVSEIQHSAWACFDCGATGPGIRAVRPR